MTGVDDRIRLRVGVVAVVVLSMFGVLLTRLWFLQVLAGDRYAEAAESNHVRLVFVEAPRGRILDRNGTVLVKNRPARAVGIRVDDLPRNRERARAVKRRLARLLGITVREIDRKLRDPRTSPYEPAVIAKDIPIDVVLTIAERQESFPGVETLTIPVRTYPYGSLAAHVLGYVGETSEAELRAFKGYRLGDQIGKTGVERTYERWLRGSPGLEKLEVDATGRVLNSLGHVDPVPGADLVLSIDVAVQEVVEASLEQGVRLARSRFDRDTGRNFRAPAASAVVLDPRTGEVIALASYPTFDPRRFVGGVSDEYWSRLNDPDRDFPLLNRAAQAGYAPGSTFKAVTATAALASGTAGRSAHYPCTSSYRLGTGLFRNWRPRSASLTIEQSLIESCDTIYYRFGANWWFRERRDERAGRKVRETLQEWSRRFGLGAATGIDLPDETTGRVPGRATRLADYERNKDAWCRRWRETRDALYEDLCERGYIWRGGDAVNMSIGQGELEATPLQMAVAYGAIANGGRLMQPHLGRRIVSPAGQLVRRIKPKVRGKVGADGWIYRYVARALGAVPERGTATFPFRGWPHERIPVAAKTGSSQIAGKQTFSWFASFAPADDPRYAAVAVFEEAGYGAQVAGPVVRRIYDQIFDLRPLPIVYGGRSD